MPADLTSSPIQLLIADGVIVSRTLHSGPLCSSEIGGQNNPARAEIVTLPIGIGLNVR